MKWTLAPALGLLLVLCAVPAVVVIAGVSEESLSPESGSHDEVRFAQPRRAVPPTVAARGRTDDGRPYSILVSRPAADPKQICVDVDFEDQRQEPDGPAGLLSAGFCADPSQRPLGAVMSETFIDPVTLEQLPSPRRFVYGYAADEDVSTLRVATPDGGVRTTRATPAPGMGLSVFGMSAPTSKAGQGVVTATDGGGRAIRRQYLGFHGPAHQAAPPALPGGHDF